MPEMGDEPESTRVERLRARFRELFGGEPDFIARAPGRINLIGEHTDYNGGYALPVAIDRTVLVAVRKAAETTTVDLASANYDSRTSFQPGNIERAERAGSGALAWSNYVRGVAWAFGRRKVFDPATIPGAQLLVAGNVPEGAGLSSSAALEVASALSFIRLAGAVVDKVTIALCAQTAENEFVGLNSGIMDQFISSLGQPEAALLIDTRTLTYQVVPLGLEQLGYKLVAVNSAVPHSLITSAYNDRVAECIQAAYILQPLLNLGRGAQLRDITLAQLEAHKDALPALLYRRAHHVISENERTLAAVALMQQGLARDANLQQLGELLYSSHASLRDDYEVSSKELDLLVELARSTPGVVGARMTGGGFGGCTVNVVAARRLTQFREQVVQEYRRRTGLDATMYVCKAVQGGSYIG